MLPIISNQMDRYRALSFVLALIGLVAVPVNVKLKAAELVAVSGMEELVSNETTEIVVIGQGPRSTKLPGTASVLLRQDWVKTRPLSVNEVLRRVPGLYPRDEEGLGLRPNIGLRGLSPSRSTKVLLLEDGMPLSYAPYGDNATYSMPPFRRFSRIEVLKGASQVRFGPQSVGGVINFITPKAPDDFGGELMIGVGENGYGEIDFGFGGPLPIEFARDWSYLVHVNATGFDGVRENTRLSTQDIWMKLEGSIGANQALSLKIGRAHEDSQLTYSGLTALEYKASPRANPFSNDRLDFVRRSLSLSHVWDLSPDLEIKTSLYGVSFDRDWWRQSSNSAQRPNDASDPLCAGLANLYMGCGTEGRLRGYQSAGLESRLKWKGSFAGADTVLTAGIRVHEETQKRRQVNADAPHLRVAGTSVNGGLKEDNVRTAKAFSSFVSFDLDYGKMTIQPGIRGEWIDYGRQNRLNGARGSTKLDVLVPGLGLSYELKDNWIVYGGVHKGFAPPRVEDIITNAGGSVQLDPEESMNYELGLRTKSRFMNFDMAWFLMDFDNQIIPSSVAGGAGASLTNGGKTRQFGLEAALTAPKLAKGFKDDHYWSYQLSLTNLTQARFEGVRLSNISGFGTTSVTGNRLPYAPEWTAQMSLSYHLSERANVSLEFTHTAEVFTDDLNTVAESLDGQRGLMPATSLINLTVNMPAWSSDANIYVSVKNLTDEDIIVDRSRGILPGAPRLVMAGLITRF
jgi:Fe(3+) dicitrate transport protein